MTTRINQLSSTDDLQTGDQVALYSAKHGDTRKTSLNKIKEFVLEDVQSGGGTGGPIEISDVTGLQTALDGKETAGTASSFMAAHLSDLDPHSQYTTASELTTALSAKAPIVSPALTGTPTAPTAAVGTNTTQLATTAFFEAGLNAIGLDMVSAAPVIGDLDDVTVKAGMYYVNGSTIGTNPVAATTPGFLLHKVYGGAGFQLFQPYGVDRLFYRRRSGGGAWSGWKELASLSSPTFTGTVGGITAAMIANTPAGTIAASTVQDAINELDSEKLALSGGTLSGPVNAGDQVLSRGMMKDMGDVFVDKGNSGTTTQTLDYTAGSHQKITATGNHTIATSNWPPTGNLGEMLLELVNGAAFTITWPTINWVKSDGTTTTTFASNGVTLQSSGTDFAVLWSRDGGTTIYGKFIR